MLSGNELHTLPVVCNSWTGGSCTPHYNVAGKLFKRGIESGATGLVEVFSRRFAGHPRGFFGSNCVVVFHLSGLWAVLILGARRTYFGQGGQMVWKRSEGRHLCQTRERISQQTRWSATPSFSRLQRCPVNHLSHSASRDPRGQLYGLVTSGDHRFNSVNNCHWNSLDRPMSTAPTPPGFHS